MDIFLARGKQVERIFKFMMIKIDIFCITLLACSCWSTAAGKLDKNTRDGLMLLGSGKSTKLNICKL